MAKFAFLVSVLLVALSGFASAPPGWVFEKDVAYGEQSQAQRLDIMYPQSRETPLPAVLHIHGGGWQLGDKGGEKTAELLRNLAKEGYISVSINYRLSDEAKFPAAVEDCKLAVRWLRAHALTYGIDGGRIAALGASAGGHLAAMLAVAGPDAGLEGSGHNEQSSAIQAAVPVCAPLDLRIPLCEKFGDKDPLVCAFLGGTPSTLSDLARRASPIAYVKNSVAPMLFVHGSSDGRVEPGHSIRMVEALRKAGARAELILVENGRHGMEIAREIETFSGIIVFLNDVIKGK